MLAIKTQGLTKTFGKLKAVDSLTLDIPYGEIFGLLGPNGAGKTTTLSMLCTILQPTGGSASVNGHDIGREPDTVRKSIGIVFQDPSIDDRLTGLENLELHAALYGVPKKEAGARIREVLELVELADRAGSRMKTYSGGMRRRLELARGLLHYPKILFLDEPTIGLDPQTRSHIWKYIKDLLQREKITVILTTHYMEEADALCNRVGIMDRGKIIALDTPQSLKASVGGDVITVETAEPQRLLEALRAKYSGHEISISGTELRFTTSDGRGEIAEVVRAADAAGAKIDRVSVKEPTLNDVFLHYTGHQIREESAKSMGLMSMVRRRRIK